MRLTTKVALGFALVLAIAAGAGWNLLRLVDRVHAENVALAGIGFRVADLGRQLRTTVDRLDEFDDKFVVLRDQSFLTRLERFRDRMDEDLARLRALDLSESERARAEALEEAWEEYLAQVPRRERAFLAGGTGEAGTADREAGRIDPEAPTTIDPEVLRTMADQHTERLTERIAALLEASRTEMERRVAESAVGARQARETARWGAVVALATALALALVILAAVRRPLGSLTRGTRAVAEGDLAHRVEATGSSELAGLARDFNVMAERLEELDSMKKDFIAGLSHDLRTPLASIEETTRLLLDGLAGPLEPRQQRMLELNLQATERLAGMIGDLLELRRLEAGNVIYHLEPIDLAQTVEAALADCESLVRRADQEVRADLPAAPVRVEGDPALLLQAVRNLVANASKFTPRKGEMGVRLEPPAAAGRGSSGGDGALIEVWDTGPGVPDEAKERIFDQFVRADETKKGNQGTGLGLAIAHTIVEDHGGALWVEDRSGGGSRFFLRLPAAPPAGSRAARSSSHSSHKDPDSEETSSEPTSDESSAPAERRPAAAGRAAEHPRGSHTT